MIPLDLRLAAQWTMNAGGSSTVGMDGSHPNHEHRSRSILVPVVYARAELGAAEFWMSLLSLVSIVSRRYYGGWLVLGIGGQ